jgi:hypothetical protein
MHVSTFFKFELRKLEISVCELLDIQNSEGAAQWFAAKWETLVILNK